MRTSRPEPTHPALSLDRLFNQEEDDDWTVGTLGLVNSGRHRPDTGGDERDNFAERNMGWSVQAYDSASRIVKANPLYGGTSPPLRGRR